MNLYCDYNSTTPLAAEVFTAMKPYFTKHHGNPSSRHQPGQKSGLALQESRRKVAEKFGVQPEDLLFTASGSEANSLAVRGVLSGDQVGGKILTTAGEHPSLQLCFDYLENQGKRVLKAPLDENGAPPADWFRENIGPEAALVSIMAANNETGVVYPVEKVAEIVDHQDCLLHVDAVQAAGKIKMSPIVQAADLVSLSAHKFRGPPGVGILIAAEEVPLTPLVFGHQENELRGGTENVPGIVGVARAVEMIAPEKFQSVRTRRDQLEEYISDNLAGIQIIGRGRRRLANTCGLFVNGIVGAELVMKLDRAGIYISAGSACSSGVSRSSEGIQAVATATGFAPDSFVRISLSPQVTEKKLNNLAETFCRAVNEMRT
ncbi:MAG: cysteine desulfurase family protein [bacterium]